MTEIASKFYFIGENMQIFSFSPFGYEGALVSVEVDLRRGIPAIDMVGLADGAVKESRERMKSAIRNSGFEFPCERVLISLSPADLKKEGAAFDLAVALAVLKEKNEADNNKNKNDAILVMGELELNGRVRPVRAIHAAVTTAKNAGIRKCIVPLSNSDEARQVKEMKVFGADNLTDAFNALLSDNAFSEKSDNDKQTETNLPQDTVCINGIYFLAEDKSMDFSQIRGQNKLIRALQIAVAGGHNILAFGPPGCGKTLSLQRFPALQPLLTTDQAQSVTRIYSIAGLLKAGQPLIRTAPFRMPHQTATIEGICGGGPHLTPGEISLAHNGALFLDEAAEYRTSVLQMLRVPLETKSITLSRAGRSTVFPADFQLLLATNPCPCGNYGSSEKICLCSAHSVELYWKKFSGPLLDRIELRVQVDHLNEQKKSKEISKTTKELREEIAKAVYIQRKRQGKKNSHLSPAETADYCKLSSKASEILNNACERYGFSPRAASSCIKVARTIADMNEKEEIDSSSMEEAVTYRKAGTNGENFSSLM